MDIKNKKNKSFLLVLLLILFSTFFFGVNNLFALSVDLHVLKDYSSIYPGDRIYFEIELNYPENNRRKDLKIEYNIIKDQKLIAKSKFLKAVESEASFIDYIAIPEMSDYGMYEVKVIIEDYEDLHEEVSTSFQVIKESRDELKLYFILILSVVFFVFLVVVLDLFIIRKRKKWWKRRFF